MEFRDIYHSIFHVNSKRKAIKSLFDTNSSSGISSYLSGEARVKVSYIQEALIREGTIITSTTSTQPISPEANKARYNISSDTIVTTLNSKYIQGDQIKALQLLECLCDAIDGLLAPILVEKKRTTEKNTSNTTDLHYKIIQGADNFQMVTCYLDSLLFAMFARIDNFEPILLNSGTEEQDFSPSTDKKQKQKLNTIRTLLRFYVSMLRKGCLIKTDITQFLLDSIFDAGWLPMNYTNPSSTSDPYKYEQQDTSELFYFITESLNMPLLTLKVDIAHGGKDNAEDDHKLINERLLNVPVPGNENDEEISLEECLENYFANSVVVERHIERRRTLDSLDMNKTMLLMGRKPSDADSIITKKGRQFSIHIRSIDTEGMDDTIVETHSINTFSDDNEDNNYYDGGDTNYEEQNSTAKDMKNKSNSRNANGVLRIRSDSTGSYRSLRSSYSRIPPGETINEGTIEHCDVTDRENLGTQKIKEPQLVRIESSLSAPPAYDFLYGRLPRIIQAKSNEIPAESNVKAMDNGLRSETPLIDPSQSHSSLNLLQSQSPHMPVGSIPPIDQDQIQGSGDNYSKKNDFDASLVDRSKDATPPLQSSELRRRSTSNSLWTTKNQISLPAWMFLQLLPFYTRVKSISELSHKNDSSPVATHFAEARPVLVMCLKRYSWDDRGHAKRNGRTVVIPNTIYLPTFVADEEDGSLGNDQNSNGNLFGKFKLVLESAVCHRGNSTHSGHYVAVGNEKKKEGITSDFETKDECENKLVKSIRTGSQRWLIFDDLKSPRKVEPVDFDQVFANEFPYLLFYRLVPLSLEELADFGRNLSFPNNYDMNLTNYRFGSDEESSGPPTGCDSVESCLNQNAELDRYSGALYASTATGSTTSDCTNTVSSCPPITEGKVSDSLPLEDFGINNSKGGIRQTNLNAEVHIESKLNSGLFSTGRDASRSRSLNRTDPGLDGKSRPKREKSVSRTRSILRKINSTVSGSSDKADKFGRKEAEKDVERERELGTYVTSASTPSSSAGSLKSAFLNAYGGSDVDSYDHPHLGLDTKQVLPALHVPNIELTPCSSPTSSEPLDIEKLDKAFNLGYNLACESENVGRYAESHEEGATSIYSVKSLTRLSPFNSTHKSKLDSKLEVPKSRKDSEKKKKKEKKKANISQSEHSTHGTGNSVKLKHLHLHKSKKSSKANEFREEKCIIM